jgi:hypothetical protein
VGHFFCQERRSDGGIERALREGVNDMVNKQPLTPLRFTSPLGVTFAIYVSFAGDVTGWRRRCHKGVQISGAVLIHIKVLPLAVRYWCDVQCPN